MKKIYYWAPCLDNIGTYKAVINSAISISKYSKNLLQINIINACGEWDSKKKFFQKNNINVIDLNFSYFNFLPKKGYLGSRLSNMIIFFFSIFPLFKLLIKVKPNFFVGHLITILPLILFNLFDFQTKFILRISGFPKLNFLRLNLWKFLARKIFKITCPSVELQKQLITHNIFDEKKILFLPDPIINMKKFKSIILKETKNYLSKKRYFIAVGRLTKQKNFSYLIDEFSSFLEDNSNYNLLIFGEGEERSFLEKKIKRLKCKENIFLMGFNDEIYSYMKGAKAFILSSLWEDPGFVLIESALCNLFIISSDCKNGPSEFLQNGKGGLLYSSNKKNELKKTLIKFEEISSKKINSMKLIAKKNCKNYTLLRHYNLLDKLLNTS